MTISDDQSIVGRPVKNGVVLTANALWRGAFPTFLAELSERPYHLGIIKYPNGDLMSASLQTAKAAQPRARILEQASFWGASRTRTAHSPSASRRSLDDLVVRVKHSTGVALFDAVEDGVPTYLVDVIADATRLPVATVMDLIGVSVTTFRRKDEAREPLPDVAGHRLMGFLRLAATLNRLLEESGDHEAVAKFDQVGWLANWMQQALPDLGGKTPGEMLRNPEGHRVVEELLERMRGGLVA